MNLKQIALSTIIILIFFTSHGQKKKALVIGIDGLQYSQIEKANTPNMDNFHIKRGFTGGIYGKASEQVTYSGPGWMSILTGVWADQHGITSNDGTKLSNAPSIFSFIRDHDKDAYITSIATWKEINLILKNDLYKTNFATVGGSDFLSTDIVINQIEDYAPDFSFIHLDVIDHAGHEYGFGSIYTEATEFVDSLIGKIMSAVNHRRQKYLEDWLVILVTDHGRDKKGFSHGAHKANQKTIFIGMNTDGNDYFKNSDDGRKIDSIKEIETLIPQTSVVPTVLTHLEIPIKDSWKLAGKSLIH